MEFIGETLGDSKSVKGWTEQKNVMEEDQDSSRKGTHGEPKFPKNAAWGKI